MARGISFNKIDGLELEDSGMPIMLKATGTESALTKLKKKLTIRNNSVYYELSALKKKKDFWLKRQNHYDTAEMHIAAINQQIHQLMADSEQTYYWEDDNVIYIPAGLWWLSKENPKGDPHLNNEIAPYYLPGLRPYQEGGLKELFKYKRATAVLGTGLGKTRMIISVCIAAAKAGKRSMIVVPSDHLVGQITENVKEFHKSVTGASSKRRPKLGTDVIVCTVGTAAKYIDAFHVILVDEAHHTPADTWQTLLGGAERAEYCYNFTATPFRSDGLDLAIHAFAGPTIYERDVKWGIDNDWLCKFDAYKFMIPARNKKGEQLTFTDGTRRTTAYKKLVGNAYFLNIVAEQVMSAAEKGRKVIVLFKTLEPAKALRKACGNQFHVASAEFKKPLHDFSSGKTNVLIATDKLVSEGIDIPDADVLFLLTQNSSDVITFQALGRILRKSEEKKKPMVVDCVALGYNQFLGSSQKRSSIYDEIADSNNVTRFR